MAPMEGLVGTLPGATWGASGVAGAAVLAPEVTPAACCMSVVSDLPSSGDAVLVGTTATSFGSVVAAAAGAAGSGATATPLTTGFGAEGAAWAVPVVSTGGRLEGSTPW